METTTCKKWPPQIVKLNVFNIYLMLVFTCALHSSCFTGQLWNLLDQHDVLRPAVRIDHVRMFKCVHASELIQRPGVCREDSQ